MNNKTIQKLFFVFFLLGTITLSAQSFQWNTPQPKAKAIETQMDETGYAVYYANYLTGNPTAMGENYDPNLMTAAHHKLPLGTIVKITRMDNGLSTTVRINDRGAYCDDCVVDLSLAAAKQIDLIRAGRTKVYLTVIGFSNTNPPTPAAFVNTPQNNDRLTARGVPASYSKPPVSSVPQQQFHAQEPAYQVSHYDQQVAQQQVKGGQALNKPVPAPQSTNASTSKEITNGFAIQLGSYGQINNAERHLSALKNKGFDQLYIEKSTKADGQPINRVMVAPFTSMVDAKQYLKDLHDFHNMDGIVVRIK